jgi:MoaA/NifB/PqqE/SkfB family radical SAM enzyme
MRYITAKSFANKQLNKLEIKRRKVRLHSRPIEISLEPTLRCNANCVMCNRQFVRKEQVRNSGLLSWETFDKVRSFFPYAESVLLGGFGESLLHPDYVEMVKEIKKHGPIVYFFTNAVSLKPEIAEGLIKSKLDQICVSIGGASPETHAYVRGADTLGKVIENLRELNRLKGNNGNGHPSISFNVVAMNSVLPEITGILDLAKDLNVESVWMPNIVAQQKEMIEESPWTRVEEAKGYLREAENKAIELGLEIHLPNLNEYVGDCLSFFQEIYITWDGKVLSCPFERFILGDLETHTLEEIWNGPGYLKVRKDYHEKGIQKVCPNCTKWSNEPSSHLEPSANSREFAEKLF